ncbi:hypothetical protein HO173_002301 [Letharia columbiana]|uniref:Uncharacterized protein n=1 Tax=Letharia columbiana TaxID=112416 RepID=A0A8H6G3K3_9LECA|nr:uncharacterized protein HO173_002301 [Letharia columbiana]KAF6239755.1 hypothetical protein HO173_002301 [Letharia columbiana]
MGRVFSCSKAVLIDLIEKKMLCYTQNPYPPVYEQERLDGQSPTTFPSPGGAFGGLTFPLHTTIGAGPLIEPKPQVQSPVWGPAPERKARRLPLLKGPRP